MRINAKPGKESKLELTKTERAKLDGAEAVLALLEQHGTADLKSAAEDARRALTNVTNELDGVPAEAPPY